MSVEIGGVNVELTLKNGSTCLIDDEDSELVSQHHWHVDGLGYARTNIWKDGRKQSAPRMHRLVMRVTDPNIHVDHINGDKLDNRKSNLRLCNRKQNLQNRTKQSNNQSGYKGVVFDKSRGRWRAEIGYNGKRKHLGRFDAAEDAYEAYCKAAELYHGEFANLN